LGHAERESIELQTELNRLRTPSHRKRIRSASAATFASAFDTFLQLTHEDDRRSYQHCKRNHDTDSIHRNLPLVRCEGAAGE
jgi:hypothetical protein